MIAAPPLPLTALPSCRAAERLYGRLLATAAAGAATQHARLRSENGRGMELPIGRWVAPADADDAVMLAGLEGPVLDMGCGPGRHVAALLDAGIEALGVDISSVAVAVTRERGGEAIFGSVFDVPAAGRWRTALLLDGNIGIGGHPRLLLERTRELLVRGGVAVVELDPPGARTERTRVRLEAHGAVSEWFMWARVGVDGIGELARAAHLQPEPARLAGGRWYVRLHRP